MKDKMVEIGKWGVCLISNLAISQSLIPKLFLLILCVNLLTGCIRVASVETPTITRVAVAMLPTSAVTATAVPPTAVPTSTHTPIPTPSATPSPGRTAVPPSPTAPVTPTTSLPHYQMSVNLDMLAHQAVAQQTVTLTNQTADSWDELVFNVSTAYWPGIFVMQSLAINDQPVAHTLDVTMLHVPLPEVLLPGATAVATLSYTLNLPPLDPAGWGPTGNAGWGPELIQMGDWYPALVPYQPGTGWQTWLYKAVGDPVISPLADYDVTINAPPDVAVAAPGFLEQVGETRRYAWPRARAFAFLASPEYRVIDGRTTDGIPVTVYVTRAHQSAGGVVMDTAVRALQLFNEQIGPYPYPELVIAENGFLTAMEYSGLVSLSGVAFDNYNNTPESLLIAIIAHEVAHQWWYGGVGNDQVDEGWLDESLAMWSELLYYERLHPESVAWWWQFRVDRWQPTGPVNASIYDYPSSETYVHNMYGRAAYFIQELHAIMGDEPFWAFLRDYYGRYQHNFSHSDAFFATAQAHTDTDLTPLKQKYFQE